MVSTAPDPGAPQPAPVWLRLASAALHLLLGLSVLGVGSAVLGPVLGRERRERLLAWLEPFGAYGRMAVLQGRLSARNRPSPVDRRLGLRLVDARSGGPVTLSSALREAAVDAVLNGLVRRITGPGLERFQERREAAEAAGRAELAADAAAPDAFTVGQLTAARMSADRGCLTGGLTGLAIRWLLPLLSVPLTRRRQSLRQLAAGTMVVRVADQRGTDTTSSALGPWA